MTESELRDRFETWKRRLGLDHWRIALEIGGVDDATAYMDVTRSTLYERAVVRVQPWLIGEGDPPADLVVRGDALDDAFIDVSLVHELLHLHTRDMVALVRQDCDGLVHPDAYRQLDLGMKRAEEQCVDRLAEALGRAFADATV